MPKYKNNNEYPVNIPIRNDYLGLFDNILIGPKQTITTFYIIPLASLPDGVVLVDIYPLDNVYVYSANLTVVTDSFYEIKNIFDGIQANITLSIKNLTASIMKLWINNLFDATNAEELAANLSNCIYIDENSEFKIETHTSLIYSLKFQCDADGQVIINAYKNYNLNY